MQMVSLLPATESSSFWHSDLRYNRDNKEGIPMDAMMKWHDGGGLYVHVAYCRSKCIYCDFFSAGERIADWHAYVNALCAEFQNRIDELAWPLRTVYFGGGTPSLMPEDEFSRICAFFSPYMDKVEEFTLEVNPDDVYDVKLTTWKRAGVNRISMGIQTFDDSCLKAIGRRHDSKTALIAYEYVRKVFDNVSIDLMFGLPGQTIEVWRNDIRTALALRPEHISAYCLMFEDGTAMTALRDSGRLTDLPEEVTEEMFRILIEEFSKAGYDHYEISNFALPGYRSRHNSSYWLQMPYIGLGPSAHSFDGIKMRKANRADVRGYLAYFTEKKNAFRKETAFSDVEILTEEELKEEYILTRMRMREGIPLEDFRVRFGDNALSDLIKGVKYLKQSGKIKLNDSNLVLSEEAIFLSDSIILELASNC